MTDVFGEYAEVYSALYADKNYPEEADYLAKLFGQHGAGKGSSLIEFGAGNGQLSLELTRLGFDVLALDLSPEMVAHSVQGAEVRVGDIRTFRSDSKVQGVVAFFHVLSYLRTNDDVSHAFRTVASLLAKGGVFVADFWFAPAVRNLKPEVRVKQAISKEVEVFRLAEPEWDQSNNWVDVLFTGFFRQIGEQKYKKFEEKHAMRYFDEEELASLARGEGMQLTQLEETLTGAKPSNQTWGVTAIFKKL